ncbi:1-deoxy-D-xylulose-5-phosphate synthase N-terminal domain-containing protein, partial [Listeria fleischmannii]
MLKKITNDELNILVKEARTALLEKISRHGGHNGPNL